MLKGKKLASMLAVTAMLTSFGLTNLTYGEAFYLPMVEVISYLEANNFTCYIVSASDRPLVRALVHGALPIAPNQVIGSDPANRCQPSRPN
ncbi:hypothetical protein [Megasphaera sp.]|uniref:hypothetical protein n=1 Tax=Megasphaera sp. TaxID=2023260 RepID=UPI003521DDC3